MSATTSFRSVDIDRLDPDSPENVVAEIASSGVTKADVSEASREVKSALTAGNGTAALKAAVANPPYGSDESTKDAALDVVLQVLSSLRVSEIEPAVKQLSGVERTVLVKYLYKASGSPKGKTHGAILLNWMERTFAVAGQGSIIKHITDRRTI